MEPKKAYVIHVNGTVTPVYVDDYKDIQSVVGGHFDLICSESGDTSFWINDEGKLLGLAPNFLATKILWQLNPAFDGIDYLVGPVLITGGADEEGETLSVGQEAAAAILANEIGGGRRTTEFFNSLGL